MSEENRKKEIRKRSRKLTSRPRRRRPSQPTRPTRGTGVFFPVPRLQASRWNDTEPAGRSPRHQPSWRPPRRSYRAVETPQVPRLHFPPPELSPLPLLFVSVAAKYHRGAHRRIHV